MPRLKRRPITAQDLARLIEMCEDPRFSDRTLGQVLRRAVVGIDPFGEEFVATAAA